jgi:hypothetical protein
MNTAASTCGVKAANPQGRNEEEHRLLEKMAREEWRLRQGIFFGKEPVLGSIAARSGKKVWHGLELLYANSMNTTHMFYPSEGAKGG